MHHAFARYALTFIVFSIISRLESEPKGYPYAYFEPPRSVGTPISDLARPYTGRGLADRIAGRLRLETDMTLNEAARQLIRNHLARES
jgi:hypothetical protein